MVVSFGTIWSFLSERFVPNTVGTWPGIYIYLTLSVAGSLSRYIGNLTYIYTQKYPALRYVSHTCKYIFLSVCILHRKAYSNCQNECWEYSGKGYYRYRYVTYGMSHTVCLALPDTVKPESSIHRTLSAGSLPIDVFVHDKPERTVIRLPIYRKFPGWNPV